MSIKALPAAPVGRPCAAVSSYVAPRALDRWDTGVRAAADESDDRTIGIYDVIGQDWWTGEGVTAKRIAGALRALGRGSVTVVVNSPGGDMFEGLAIYNLLREHQGEVTVKVPGLAASAASVVAMAGDTVLIPNSGFFMVHNCWVLAQGNRHDLREFADTMEPFDAAMADIYAARCMVLDAARRRDDKLPNAIEASCAKMFTSEMCGRVADRAVQIFGGAGYMSEYVIERFYRDVRLFRIYEGTTQIQQTIIARNMLRDV